MMSNISFIIKCTRNCNFACNYCINRRYNQSSLSFNNLVFLIRSSLLYNQNGNTTFIYHGGEPLLLGINYFNKIIHLQKLCITNGQHIRNLIQTNGSLLNKKWIDFFKTNGIGLGISLDGPPEIHDKHRKYKNGNKTFYDVLKAINILHINEFNFGTLSVITNDVLNYNYIKFLDFFIENKISNIGFLSERPSKMKFKKNEEVKLYYEYLTKYSIFMCKLFDLWIKIDNDIIRIRELLSKLYTIIGTKSRVCTDDGFCVGKFFGINESGEVAHCDKFFDNPLFNFGNLKKDFLSDIFNSDNYNKAVDLEFKVRNKCKSCDFFNICKGGCLYDAIIFENSGLKERKKVCHVKIILEHIYNKLSSYL